MESLPQNGWLGSGARELLLLARLGALGCDLREHVRLAQDQNIVGAELDLGAAVLPVDDLVAHGDFHRDDLPRGVAGARSDGEDAAALRLLLRGIGQDDAARGRLLLLECLEDQTIAQRLQIHSGPPVLRTLWQGVALL